MKEFGTDLNWLNEEFENDTSAFDYKLKYGENKTS